MNIVREVQDSIQKHNRRMLRVAACATLFVLVLVSTNYFVIEQYSDYILEASELSESAVNDRTVGIVLGGGILDGKPRPLLKDRLDTAALLIKSGTIRTLIVSGDNRAENYNEPKAMKEYFVIDRQIDSELIQLDNAGRSTYETCERANKIFRLEKVLLISESTHLTRAIYLCRSFGIEAYGYSSNGQSAAGLQVGQRFREVLARTKASINIYIVGEETVLGPKIKL